MALAPARAVALHGVCEAWTERIEAIRRVVKAALLVEVEARGEAVGEKATRRLFVGETAVEVRRPQRAVDPALLRQQCAMHGLPPAAGLSQLVSHVVDDVKVAALVLAGDLSAVDINACRPESKPQVHVIHRKEQSS